MKTKKSAIIFTLVVICLSWGIGYAQDPTVAQKQQKEPEISFTYQAGGLLEIKNIPSSNTLFQKDDLLEMLLRTTCSEQIAERVFEKPFNRMGSTFNIECSLESKSSSSGLFHYLYNLQINISEEHDTPPMALELRQALVHWLLNVISDEHQDVYVELADRIFSLTKDKDKAESEMRSLERAQKKWIETGGPRVLSRNRLQEEIRNLEQLKQQWEMELYGTDARQRAMEEQIAKLGKQAEAKLDDDPILAELKKVLQIREEKLKRETMMMNQGTISPTELADSREHLALARIEVARRREEIGKTAGGESLNNWNIELADLAIKRAEIESRFSLTQKQLEQIKEKDLLTLAYQIEDLNRDISNLRSTVENASEEIDNWQRELERLKARQPKVRLLGDR
jgi:hypothetical protein